MSDDPADNVEPRLTALERDLARVRDQATLAAADAGAARLLASGADQDVSEVRAEMRAHTSTLNALRETQLEHGQQIADLRTDLTGLDQRVERGFASLGDGMAQIHATLAKLVPED